MVVFQCADIINFAIRPFRRSLSYGLSIMTVAFLPPEVYISSYEHYELRYATERMFSFHLQIFTRIYTQDQDDLCLLKYGSIKCPSMGSLSYTISHHTYGLITSDWTPPTIRMRLTLQAAGHQTKASNIPGSKGQTPKGSQLLVYL